MFAIILNMFIKKSKPEAISDDFDIKSFFFLLFFDFVNCCGIN